MARLKTELGTASGKQYPWWKEVAGIFADDPAFEEAMKRSFRLNSAPGRPRSGIQVFLLLNSVNSAD